VVVKFYLIPEVGRLRTRASDFATLHRQARVFTFKDESRRMADL